MPVHLTVPILPLIIRFGTGDSPSGMILKARGTHQVTRCSNRSRRQVAVTNRFVCAGKYLRKSLSPQRVAQNQIRLNKCNLLRRQNSAVQTKIFPKILQQTRSDLLQQPIARPVHTEWFVTAKCCSDMSLSVYGPDWVIHYLSWFSKTRNVCSVYSGTRSSSRAWNLKPVTSTSKSQQLQIVRGSYKAQAKRGYLIIWSQRRSSSRHGLCIHFKRSKSLLGHHLIIHLLVQPVNYCNKTDQSENCYLKITRMC